ncbi:MAG: ABC transporter permease/substrate-binding protein [Bacteroidota bacterium]
MDLLHYINENFTELISQIVEHFKLTLSAISIAAITGVSLGALISVRQRFAPSVLAIVNVFQTIPSLALLGFLIPLIGIGILPAIFALFIYALLPIVRNTYTGITQIDSSTIEAAESLGMNTWQLLSKVQLPIATPIIIAGIRTASVINVGIATLCALIAAGGLGESIFGGISLNNTDMILAGAIPASVMALLFDGAFGIVQRFSSRKPGTTLILFITLFIVTALLFIPKASKSRLVAGFNTEFIQREDGFIGLDSVYQLPVEIKELEIGLMYKALANGDVDFIDGFSTDGRVEAYDLVLLEDDKSYFPPYYAAPLVREETLAKYPGVRTALQKLTGNLSAKKMSALNYEVDQNKKSPAEVAQAFLKELGITTAKVKENKEAQIIIGCKSFTESYILAHLFGQIIEAETGLTVGLKTGFGGTQLLFNALTAGAVDLYPEYTGTGMLVLLQPEKELLAKLLADRKVFDQYLISEFKNRHQLQWLGQLGFNNTFAIMMRKEQADALNIRSISDLSQYLKN